MRPAVVLHPDYLLRFPCPGRFPAGKWEALQEQLRSAGLLDPARTFMPRPASGEELMLAHAPEHVLAALEGRCSAQFLRQLGLPWSSELLRRARATTGGTVLAARLALEHGVACNLAGGSHHAGPNGPSGFCLFNDVAVAIRVLRSQGLIRRVLVVDLDVHQGDGTARIFAGDSDVWTFSMHCRANFPARKARSRLDVELEPATCDRTYVHMLAAILPGLLARAQPDLVFYNAGVDPHRDDWLGRLALTDQGLAERDALVLDTMRRAGVPVACVTGGGYGEPVAVARRHAILHRVLADLPAW